jgi:hypothetical protein
MSNAMSGGKQAARKIDERLMASDRWLQLFPDFDFSHQAPPEPSLSHRHTARSLPAGARAHSQQEVVTDLSSEEALEECRRCLRCDLRNTPGAS